ncbi:ferredoxin [Nocardia sp. alder85J]|uniref:ferredoxin n=1 Tax=Nocardia sp. alder85J TaxID=2862949 RepID=UPI001CD6DAF0|nr:ferredoxin [Nocardia sp. alder85J]MCX4090880.1 ferredoxin [Nocardia sp. alder85J]
MPEIVVDRTLCIGSGVCIVYAPGSLEHDEDSVAVPITPPGDAPDAIRNAVEGCPTGALRLLDP